MADQKEPAADEPGIDQAIEGARRIWAYLEKVRDDYAADIGVQQAARWYEDVLVHLHENGILIAPDVPREVVTSISCLGDTWRAFQAFEGCAPGQADFRQPLTGRAHEG